MCYEQKWENGYNNNENNNITGNDTRYKDGKGHVTFLSPI